jgi:hypothetical protein
MAKKLKALEEYRGGAQRNLYFAAGQEFEADDDLYLFLMADAPGCFEQVKAIDAPPVDKMLHKPKASK